MGKKVVCFSIHYCKITPPPILIYYLPSKKIKCIDIKEKRKSSQEYLVTNSQFTEGNSLNFQSVGCADTYTELWVYCIPELIFPKGEDVKEFTSLKTAIERA